MSKNIAIHVSHLGKQYRLGGPQEQYLTFRDAIVNTVKSPFRVFHPVKPDEMFWALKDVSFEVEQGDVVGIIGRNGAGKSTLLKILSRITTPTEGRIELHGRVGSLLEVGTGFHPEMTGRENIFLNGSILGMRKTEIEDKFDEIVKFSEIEKFLDTPVKRYSSGMYVRLAFAVAAHLDPEILLVDEVLAVGDAAFQKKCIGKMGEVAKEGKVVLFVSHNISLLRNFCNIGFIIEGGKLVRKGDINELSSFYLKNINNEKGISSECYKNIKEKANIISIKLISAIDNSDIIEYNKPLIFKIRIFSKETIQNLNVGFSIHDENGDALCVIYSGPSNLFTIKPGISEIIIDNGVLPLCPGLYTMRARLEANALEIHWPKGDIYEFTIKFSDTMYGLNPDSLRGGRMLIFPKWQLIEEIEHE